MAATGALWAVMVEEAARHRMWDQVAVLVLVALVVVGLLALVSRDPDGTRFVRWDRVRGTHARQSPGDTTPPS
jgi:hypothetical protein